MKRNKNLVSAFSLVEMMVVLTVVSILVAFAAPNIFSLVQSSTLTNEGIVLRNQLTFAQQTAVSKNADVEIRFFKWTDENSGQVVPVFSAYQLYQFNNVGEMVAISPFFRIRAPSALNENISTLLQPGRGQSQIDRQYGFISPQADQAEIPNITGNGQLVDYVSFRFRPDGSTDLPSRAGSDAWYLTLVQGEGAAEEGSLDQLRNWVCLQVNPYNGVVTEFRPTVQ